MKAEVPPRAVAPTILEMPPGSSTVPASSCQPVPGEAKPATALVPLPQNPPRPSSRQKIIPADRILLAIIAVLVLIILLLLPFALRSLK